MLAWTRLEAGEWRVVEFFRMAGLSNYFDVIYGRERILVWMSTKSPEWPPGCWSRKRVMVLCAEMGNAAFGGMGMGNNNEFHPWHWCWRCLLDIQRGWLVYSLTLGSKTQEGTLRRRHRWRCFGLEDHNGSHGKGWEGSRRVGGVRSPRQNSCLGTEEVVKLVAGGMKINWKGSFKGRLEMWDWVSKWMT